MTLSGGIPDLNAALARLRYRGCRNYRGADTLAVSVSDGSLSTSGRVVLRVKSAAKQAAKLRARVGSLRAAGALSPGLGALLTAMLDLKGDTTDALRVKAFLLEVRMLQKVGILNTAQADAQLGPGNLLLLSVTRR